MRARIATIALVLLENCRFAKVCHKAKKEDGGCPVNLTTAKELFTPERFIKNAPNFFRYYENAGQLSRQLGVPAHRRLTQLELSQVLKPSPKYPDTEFANWMAYQTNAKGQAIQKERPVQKPSPTESITQRDQEYQATFEVLEGGRESVSLDGAPGAIGFFSSLQKESEKYLGVKFKVTHGERIMVEAIMA